MKTEITYTDDEGNTVRDPAAASAAEIVETADDGTPLHRTYLERSAGAAANPRVPRVTYGSLGNPSQTHDELTAPETLTKHTWDVWLNENGMYRLVTTLDEWLQVGEADGLTDDAKLRVVANLVTLQSFEAAPETLRREAFAYLDEHAPRSTTAADES